MMQLSTARIGAAVCLLAGSLFAEELTFTPESAEWGTALTVANAQTVTIAAPTDNFASWAGAVTVQAGGTLRTTGQLKIEGAVSVQPATTDVATNGKLEVVSGHLQPKFSDRSVNGDFVLARGATLTFNCSDAFKYDGAAKTLDISGTLITGNYRQTFSSESTFKFHDGAVFVGGGDIYAGLDFYKASRVFCDGTVLFDTPVRARIETVFACADDTTLKFPRGFAIGTANITFEAKTTEEGGTGTCENLKLEITDGGASTSPLTLRGSVTYTPSATVKHAITLADNATFTYLSSEAIAKAAHIFAFPFPTITGSGTIVLAGDGVVSLPASFALPVTFAGGTVLETAGTPCALAAGSSVTAATKILVNDLAAGATTSLLTGDGVATLDATKLTVQPAHLDVAVGTASATTIAGGALVANAVAAYDATAWTEPYFVRKALIWLDAADGSAFTFDGAKVTAWKDKSLYQRHAQWYQVANYAATWGTYEVVDGVPAYQMGAVSSGIDLCYTRMTTIRTVFWAMAILKADYKPHWLGDSVLYNFHRGLGGTYAYVNGGNESSTFWCDGVQVANVCSDIPPTDRHIYSSIRSGNHCSNRLTCDRDICSDRHGGRAISELICLDVVLSDADRQTIEAKLAAKWMGDAPTAGRDVAVATLTEDLEVTGSQNYALPLIFADGASITVIAPSTTEPIIKSTSAITVTGTAIPVTINASHFEEGTYTVIEGGAGTSISVANFVANLTPPAGGTATLAVQDGKLVMIVTADGGVVSELTWRPTATAELVWSTDVISWLNDETRSAFVTGASVLFDSNESQTGEIVVNDTIMLGGMRVTGANNYTFTGTGTLDGSAPLVVAGSGKTILNGPNLGAQDLNIQSGTVELGADAGTNALGTASSAGGGVVNIGSNAQFNLNYTSTVANNTEARAAITQLKTFQIAGSGTDGRGALVNDATDGRTTHNTVWNAALRRVELTDDATIGGVDRLDVRAHASTPATMAGGIYGEGKTLTIKNSGCFGLVQLPISVGSVVIPEGGVFRPESVPTASIDIPGGITLDGGTLHGYSTTYPATMPLTVTENGGTVASQTGNTVFNGPLSVPENATLVNNGSAMVYYSGAITNEGTIKVEGGTTVLAGATTDGNHVTVTGGTLYTRNQSEGTETITQSGGTIWIDAGTDVDHLVMNNTAGYTLLYRTPQIKTLDFNGPLFAIKTDSLVGPTVETANLTLGNDSFNLLPQANGWADVTGTFNINKTAGTMYVYGPDNNEHGIKILMKGTIATRLMIGLNRNSRGGLELKPGSDLAVGSLGLGDYGYAPSAGKLIIDAGAKLSVTGDSYCRNGHLSDTPPTTDPHTIDVGGTFFVSNVVTYLGYDAPRTEMYLREGGHMALKGLLQRNGWSYGNGVGAGEGWHRFRMEGGRFDLGDGGIQDVTCVPGTTLFDLANGTLNNYAACGCTRGINIYFGETMLGGHLVYDLGDYSVDWNTGLAGSSALTIKGNANFQCAMRPDDHLQGAMLGKVTIENTGNNDLRNACVFGGGLELAAGTQATVGSWGDEKYAFTVSATENMNGVVDVAWSYPYVSPTFFTFMNADFDTNPYTSYSSFAGRGEFYVPVEKAGTWTFAGSYDDFIYFQVDSTNEVIRSGSTTCGKYCKSISLTEGWHDFTFLLGDATGACRPWGEWRTAGMSLGFLIGESTSTDPSGYTKFAPGASLGDELTLQIRPCANACVWSCQNGNGNWDTTENWAHIKVRKSVDIMHKSSNDSDGSAWTDYFQTKANRFAGWFKVEDSQSGTWTFKMVYDDNKQLTIDGQRVVSTTTSWTTIATGSMALTPGWHRWEVRTQDGGGGWGPSGYNNGNTLSYVAPDSPTEKQWNETNLKLAATLGDIAILDKTGIYRDLVLGEGATLTSSGSEAMGIYGTLKGNGTLAGSFAFKGASSKWEVAGDVNKRNLTTLAKFSAPTRATFADLAQVKATFTARPQCVRYPLATVSELTMDDVADATCEVKDASGNDYSQQFSLKVVSGQLVLVNACPSGTVIILR